MNLYFISGLGADEKAFARIHLQNVNVIHVDWIEHSKEDTVTSYAQKLLPQINTDEPFVIVALSFGGIIAQELNKFINPEKTIIISSITHQSQLPYYYQLGILVSKLLPNSFFTHTNSFINYLFGAKGKNTAVLNAILEANDPKFIKWCVQQFIRWKKSNNVPNLISIHGTHDKIIQLHKCDYTIENGTHFMVVTKGVEIQKILQKEIDDI